METINNILQEIFSNDIAIGVITGIIVAAVGVIINKKSMSGKLNVSIKDWCRLQASKIVSKGEHKNSANVEKYLLGYKFEIQPYNSSNYTKIMKNIEIEFISGKNKFVVKTEIENQKPINVLPKTCPSFNGYVHIYFVDEGLSEKEKNEITNKNQYQTYFGELNLQTFLKYDKVFLIYNDEKDKTRKIQINFKEEACKHGDDKLNFSKANKGIPNDKVS